MHNLHIPISCTRDALGSNHVTPSMDKYSNRKLQGGYGHGSAALRKTREENTKQSFNQPCQLFPLKT